MYVGGKIAPQRKTRREVIGQFSREEGLGSFWSHGFGKIFRNVVGYTFAVPTGGFSLALTTSPTARRVGAITSIASMPLVTFMPAGMRNRIFGLDPGQRGGLELESKIFRGLDLAAAAVLGGWALSPAAAPAAGAAGSAGASVGAGAFSLAPIAGTPGYGVLAASTAVPSFSLAPASIIPGVAAVSSAAPAAGVASAVLPTIKTVAEISALTAGTQLISSALAPKSQDVGAGQSGAQAPIPQMPNMPSAAQAPGPVNLDAGQAPQAPSILETITPWALAGVAGLLLYKMVQAPSYAR